MPGPQAAPWGPPWPKGSPRPLGTPRGPMGPPRSSLGTPCGPKGLPRDPLGDPNARPGGPLGTPRRPLGVWKVQTRLDHRPQSSVPYKYIPLTPFRWSIDGPNRCSTLVFTVVGAFWSLVFSRCLSRWATLYFATATPCDEVGTSILIF